MYISGLSSVWKRRRVMRLRLPVSEAAATTCSSVVNAPLFLDSICCSLELFPCLSGWRQTAFYHRSCKVCPLSTSLQMLPSLTWTVYCLWLKITQKPLANSEVTDIFCAFYSQKCFVWACFKVRVAWASFTDWIICLLSVISSACYACNWESSVAPDWGPVFTSFPNLRFLWNVTFKCWLLKCSSSCCCCLDWRHYSTKTQCKAAALSRCHFALCHSWAQPLFFNLPYLDPFVSNDYYPDWGLEITFGAEVCIPFLLQNDLRNGFLCPQAFLFFSYRVYFLITGPGLAWTWSCVVILVNIFSSILLPWD